MESEGRFLIDRNIFESRLWRDTIKFRLFFYILGKAAFKDDVIINGIKLKRGQYLRSYRSLSEDLTYKEKNGLKKYSLATVKRKIKELVEEQRLEIKETLNGTLFIVKNYDKYQYFQGEKGVLRNGNETATKQEENSNETATKQEELNIINANNANKTADDACAGEDVPTTSPKAEMGEDVPTTSPKAETDARKAMKVMENLYCQYTGRMINPLDFAVMSEIVELTTDERLIGDTMKQTKERFIPKFKGDKIRSFKYFEPSLKEAAEKERVKKNAAYTGSIDNASD